MPFCFPFRKVITMNILFIGDIMGRTGRDAVFEMLPEIKEEYNIKTHEWPLAKRFGEFVRDKYFVETTTVEHALSTKIKRQ